MTDTRQKEIEKRKKILTLVGANIQNAINLMNAGKVVSPQTIEDLYDRKTRLTEEIRQLEAGNDLPSPSHITEQTEEHDGTLPASLRIKRSYTLSPEAVAQRKGAAKGSRAKNRESQRGNKNAWKHGKYAAGTIRGKIKPCKRSCRRHPCEYVMDEKTKPGGLCPDEAADVLLKFLAIDKAIRQNNTEDFKELASFLISLEVDVLHKLLIDVSEEGTSLYREKVDKDGRVIAREVVPHPSLLPLQKMLADLRITPDEFMITPKALSRQKEGEDDRKTAADFMSAAGRALATMEKQCKKDGA